jgi:hypothetical protein
VENQLFSLAHYIVTVCGGIARRDKVKVTVTTLTIINELFILMSAARGWDIKYAAQTHFDIDDNEFVGCCI